MELFRDIFRRFDQNMKRVDNLLAVYNDHIVREGRGRRPARDADLLRAAVVMAHAAMEDMLRSITIKLLPDANPTLLDDIPIAGSAQRNSTRMQLGALVPFRHLTVQQLLEQSVKDHQNQWASFNNLGQIRRAISLTGIDCELLDFGTVSAMTSRRHRIVHYADRAEHVGGRGNHRVAPISVDTVNKYVSDLKGLIIQVKRRVRD